MTGDLSEVSDWSNMPRRSTQRGGGGGVDVVERNATSASDVSSIGCSPEAEQVDGVKTRLAQLCERDDELTKVIERAIAAREEVRAEMASVKDELDVLVNAPVSDGRDPTLWLPDELMVMIFLRVPFEVLWGGVCERVCQRWRRIVRESTLVKRCKQEERWDAYKSGMIKPKVLKGHRCRVYALAVGIDGKIYSGSNDTTIRVWSGVDGAHLQTLEGHADHVLSLAVGLDGKVKPKVAGQDDRTIRVWSAVDGAHLHTLQGHSGAVYALAVGLDGKIYSGSYGSTIGVWRGVDGTNLQTLELPASVAVYTLAVGLDGSLYSGSTSAMIRVW